MSSENDGNPGGERISISDRETKEIPLPQAGEPVQGDAPESPQSAAPEKRSLDEMTEEMFQSPAVKRLFAFCKAIGKTGHQKNVSFPDNLDPKELVGLIVDSIKESSVGYKKFDDIAETLFNGILSGKLKEKDVVFEYKDFSDGILYWLYFSIDMFGQSNGPEFREQERALHELLGNDVIVGEHGQNIDRIIDHLIKSALSPDVREFLLRATKDIHAAKSRRQLGQEQLEARREFKKQEEQSGEPAAAAEEQISAPDQVPERAEIISASLNIAYWDVNEPYEDRQQIKLSQEDGGHINPSVRPQKPIQLVDDEDMPNVIATLEVEGDKVVVIRQGKENMIDMNSGIPVQKLVIKEGVPVRIQIADEIYEIAIAEISIQKRTTITPYNPTPAETKHDDSQPQIESRESLVYSLPAVLQVDTHGQVMNTYPCLSEEDRIVSVGTDPGNDIVVPPSETIKIFNAQFLFYPAAIFFKTLDNTVVTCKNRPGGFIPPNTTVNYDEKEEDVIKMGADSSAVFFMATKTHPFTEAEIKNSLTERLGKISTFLEESGDNFEKIREAEKRIRNFNALVGSFGDKFDTTELVAGSAGLSGRAIRIKEQLGEQKRLEHEIKMAMRRHFDPEGGETAETPRPLKYAVLMQNMGTDKQALHIIFPPALTTGKNPVNMLELHVSRASKYAVQDNECTFVLDGTTGVRMVIEGRTDKKSKIQVNGQIPGTRDGKTHELDMRRPPLKDGDVIEIANNRLILEMNHEFTMRAVKPYAAEHLKQIMEVLVLLPEDSDPGEKRNARETLEHFLTTGILTEAEVKKQQVFFEEQKANREITKLACRLLDDIREDNAALAQFVETDGAQLVGLPYDCAELRAAMELVDDEAVNWDEAGWTKEQYLIELASSARIRLYAYDKKLLEIRTQLSDRRLGTRLLAIVSKDAENEYEDEKTTLLRAFDKMLVEIVSLLRSGIVGSEYEKGWLINRLSQEQYQQAEAITFAHEVMKKIHDGEAFTPDEVAQLLLLAQGQPYGAFFNFKEVEPDMPMDKFIFAKIKARAQDLIEEAREGNGISEKLGQLEGLIRRGFLSYEKIESSPEEFDDLRQNEEFFLARNAQLKAGREALEPILSSAQPDLEAIVDFAKRLAGDEIAITDEAEDEFKEYCRTAFASAVQKARFGQMRSYIAVLATTAVRLKAVKPSEIGTTTEELEHFHTMEEASGQIAEMTALMEEIKGSDFHNLHPLIKLGNHLAQQPDSLRHEGKTAEDILNELVGKKMEMMVSRVMQGQDPGFMKIIIEDMRQFGFEPMIMHCVAQSLSDAIDSLYHEIESVDTVRPFIETLRLLNLSEIVEAVRDEVVTKNMDGYMNENPPDFQTRIEKLGESLNTLGLYDAKND